MKKLFLILLVCFNCTANAQYELQDAKKLFKLLVSDIDSKITDADKCLLSSDKDDLKRISDFLKNPWKPSGKINLETWEKVRNLECNTATKRFKPLGISEAHFIESTVSPIDNIKSALPIADLQTKLIYGLTDVIIEHAKAELMIKYIDDFIAAMEEQRNFSCTYNGGKETISISYRLRDLLPQVYLFLKDQDQLFSVNIGQSFKTAFEKDIKDLAKNILEIVRSNDNIKISPEYKYLIAVMGAINDIIIGSHPSLILSKLSQQFPVNDGKEPLGISFYLLNMISQSLITDGNANNFWLNPKEILRLNDKEWEYYLALLYINHKDTLDTIFNKMFKERCDKFKGYVLNFSSYLTQLDKLMKQVNEEAPSALLTMKSGDGMGNDLATNEKKNKTTADISGYANYIAMTLEVINGSIIQLCAFELGNENLCSDINNNLERMTESAKTISRFVYDANTNDYTTASHEVLNLIKIYLKDDGMPEKFARYIFLAADLAQADSVSQVKKIIDGLIMPVGSYKVKRTQHFTVSVNSYPGLSTGREWNDADAQQAHRGAWQFSPFVPVGFDLSSALKIDQLSDKEKMSCSNSAYISIIDLGAVASYRFKTVQANDTISVANLPQITFRQILSPGIFWVHGIKNAPVSWGIGVQFCPKLREIKDNGQLTEEANVVRVNAFLSVDIPLFTLSVKSK